MKNKPSSILLGVAKSGTTSVYYHLREHPEVHVPTKETFYFVSKTLLQKGVENTILKSKIYEVEEQYDALYNEVPDDIVTLEISTGYFYYYKEIIPTLKANFPEDIKLMVILRNPVTRAYSHYKHLLRENLTDKSFLDVFYETKEREHHDFMTDVHGLGFYAEALTAFSENFEHLEVLLYDDLENNTEAFYRKISDFLGIELRYTEKLKVKVNTSDVNTDKLAFRLIFRKNVLKSIIKPIVKAVLPRERINTIKDRMMRSMGDGGSKKASLDPASFEKVAEEYAEDIKKLESLLKVDLKHWLSYDKSVNQ